MKDLWLIKYAETYNKEKWLRELKTLHAQLNKTKKDRWLVEFAIKHHQKKKEYSEDKLKKKETL